MTVRGTGSKEGVPAASVMRPAGTSGSWPAALRELLPDADAAAVLERIARALVRDVQRFERDGFAAFQQRFAQRDVLRGRSVQLSDGTAGTAQGVGADGSLLVHTAAGPQAISSSEVSVRPAAR